MKEKLIYIINDVTDGAFSYEALLNENYEQKKMLDSLQIVQLIVELENEFDIEIEDEDLSIDNMKSFDTIMELVQRLINK